MNLIIRNSFNENPAMSKWRFSFIIALIPPLVLFVMSLFVTTSPRWLENNNRSVDSLSKLYKIRKEGKGSKEVLAEYQEIKKSIGINQENPTFFTKSIIKRLVLVCVLQTLYQWTGETPILYFSSIMFESIGFSAEDASKKLNIVVAAINVVATIPSIFLVENYGRRKLLILGSFGMAISHSLIVVFGTLTENSTSLALYNWMLMFSVFLVLIFFAFTWGPIVPLIQAEIFPTFARAKANSIGNFVSWSMYALCVKITPILLQHLSYKMFIVIN